MVRDASELPDNLLQQVLETFPNPVLIKDSALRYVWVNRAFEGFFQVDRQTLRGKVDADVFGDRWSVQSDSDRQVIEQGEVDEAYETVFDATGFPRETVTRKRRLTLPDGTHYLIGTMHDVTEALEADRKLEAQSIKLKQLASTDALTSCLNRRALYEAPQTQDTSSAAVLTLDIDFFKKINDTYGHDAGDAALIHFATVVEEQIRRDDLLCRIGGEEFAVYFASIAEAEVAEVAERIRASLEERPLEYNGQTIRMTVSIGGARSNRRRIYSLMELLQESDARLYEAKSTGRNRAVLA